MIKLLFEILELLRGAAPLLTSLAIFTLLSVLLARSIKKRPTLYYVIFSIPFLLVAIPTIGRWVGIETFNLTRVPVIGMILRDYIHMATFGHPLLIVIMYMGALDPKIPAVRKLMSIRKHLSIIVGFPVLTHSLIRVANNFPKALKYFTDQENSGVGELGAMISNFSFVLGVVMLALFLPLWITSFDSVHRRMGSVRWKKFQKWSYVLYATLFIHAMGIQVGGMLNQKGAQAHRPTTEKVVTEARGQAVRGETPGVNGGQRNQVKREPQAGGRTPVRGISDINIDTRTKRYINVASLLLIYGSYLYLRLRKAARKKSQIMV